MKIVVKTPVRADQNAICTVTGNDELGSLELKIVKKGTKPPAVFRSVAEPDEEGRRTVVALTTGNIVGIAADPIWEAGDRVEFVLRDSSQNVVDAKTTIII